MAYATAFLEARAALEPSGDRDRARLAAASAASARAEAAEFLAALSRSRLPRHPHASQRASIVKDQVRAVIGPGPEEDFPALTPERTTHSPGQLPSFEHSTHMCLAALCDGWEMEECLALWARVQTGTFSSSGRTFRPGSFRFHSEEYDWSSIEVRTITRALGEHPVSIYISHGQIIAITAGERLRRKASSRPGAPAPSLSTLPDFIALPRDETGRPIIPKSRVTALVEAQEAWHSELGSLDSLSSTIVRGLLVMPKVATPSQRKTLRNHPSWEDDPAAQAALGPIIAKWLTQGVLEYVQWDDRVPVLLQPCGAVPKGSAPFYRLITDARYGNSMYSDWGVTYSSAADLSAALQPRDFTWSADLQDAYHLSVFAGCGGALRPCKRPVIQGDGSVSWIDGYIVGCSPETCLGGCDKDMSGISIHGHIFRFAACQFGQKTAGSPLNSLVLSVANYFARLSQPVHVATWVDDLHFSMRTPPHPPCAGHIGGCAVCSRAYEKAVQAEALWREKARALNLPLSEGKGHTVAQGGPFTGVHIDTLAGTYTMLADKLKSLRETFAALATADLVTPRLLARGRGKAAHYGCAIPFLAAMCPSLTQAMHQAEQAFSLPPPSEEEEAADRLFEWDRQSPLSDRTRAALRLMVRAIDDLGTIGQPIWPLLPPSAYGAFLQGHPAPDGSPIMLACAHAAPQGWGLTFRLHAHQEPTVLSGSWAPVKALLCASWMAGPAFSVDGLPVETTHQLAVAALLGFRALAERIPLRSFTTVLHIPSSVAARSLAHGSSNDPVLQDIAMLLQVACMDLRLARPLLLPGDPVAAPVPLSAAQLQLAQTDSATALLRARVASMASQAGLRLTLDLFASACNTQCARFFSVTPEPLSAGTDALAQPSWASSECPWCHTHRPDFVLMFPPPPLARAAIAKARQDQAHGIAILPCSHSAPWWPSAMSSSRSQVRPNQPFYRIRASAQNVSHHLGSPLGRLALFHFDFWRWPEPRSQPCLHGHLPRHLSSVESSTFAADALAFQALWGHSAP